MRMKPRGDFAESALAAQPGNEQASVVLAAACVRLHDYERAREAAFGVASMPDASPANRAYALGFAGDAAERLEDYEEAFANYRAANEIQREAFKKVTDAGPSPYELETIRRLRKAVDDGLGDAPPCPEG